MSEQRPNALEFEPSRYAKALETMRPHMLALPEAQLKRVYVDIPSAMIIVLGAMPKLMALREDFVRKLPEFPIELMDTLELRAMAMGYAYSVRLARSKKPEPVPQLVVQGKALRATLLADVRYLAIRGLLNGVPLGTLAKGSSHRSVVSDLFALTYVLRSHWPTIQGKTVLTLEELSAAEQVADQLLMALGARHRPDYHFDAGADLVERAFNLFIQAYDRVRKSVAHLYGKQVDQILPLIRPVRGRGKRQIAEREIAREIRVTTGMHAVESAPGADAGASAVEEAKGPAVAVGMPESNG